MSKIDLENERKILDREITLFHFKKAKIRENDGCAYNDKAICLAELGKHKEAFVCFNEGIAKDRDCVSLYHNKGWLLNSLGKYKESVLYFRKALELEENRVESLYSLADSYIHLGQKAKAKDYLQKAILEIKGKSTYIYREILSRIKDLDK